MECEVWSVECTLESVECEVWTVKCGVWSASSNFDTLRHWTTKGFAASSIGMAKAEAQDETCWSFKTSILCETAFNFGILTHWTTKGFCSFPHRHGEARDSKRDMLEPQNEHFVRGFRQISSSLTKRHACQGICTCSPLRAALPIRFAGRTQHAASEVLRLPREMQLSTSKALHLARKMQRIF